MQNILIVMDTINVLRQVSVVADSDMRIVEVSLARQSSTWQMPVAISSSDSHKCFFLKKKIWVELAERVWGLYNYISLYICTKCQNK